MEPAPPKEATVNLVLSAQMLVRKQKEDSELCQLREQAVREAKSNTVPVLPFLKDGKMIS